MEEDGKLLIEKAGTHGRFQGLSCYFIISFAYLSFYGITTIPYQKIRPEALCRLKDDYSSTYFKCDHDTYCDSNYEKIILKDESINNWIVDFEIDCEGEKSFNIIISFMFSGAFIGNIILSPLGDIYGRKPVLYFEAYGIIVIMVVALFSPSFYLVCILWFFYEGLNHIYTVLMLYASEIMSQEYFSVICSLCSCTFPLTGLLTSVLFFYIRDWRIIHAIFTVFGVAMGILLKIIIVESPQFLLSIKKVDPFLITIEKIAKINRTFEDIKDDINQFRLKYNKGSRRNSSIVSNIDLKEVLVDDKIEDSKKLNSVSIIEYFKNDSTFRIEFIVISMSFALINLVFFGVLLNIEQMDNDNIFLFSVVLYTSEIIAEFGSGFLAQKYGRIYIIKVCGYLSAVTFAGFQLFSGSFILKIFFCFWGNFGAAGVFNVVIILQAEIFDVKIRSTALSYSKLPGYFITIISPFIISIVSYPFFMYAILLGLIGFFINNCKETLDLSNPNKMHVGH